MSGPRGKEKSANVDADLAYEAAQRVVRVHQRLAEFLRAGVTLPQVDALVADALKEFGARSCFLGYRVPKSPPFPSHACISVNDCVVHGTAGYFPRPLRPADIISVDVGVLYRGWIGDAAWTYAIEERTDEADRLMRCGRECIARGIATLRPENQYIEWARTVQGVVEREYGFHLVRGLGGHGYGKKLHEPPYISNTVPTWAGEWPDAEKQCTPGTLVAVEPMIAIGTGATSQRGREWPIFTADGSLSVHYEHDVLVTEGEPRVLTHGLEDLPDVVGR